MKFSTTFTFEVFLYLLTFSQKMDAMTLTCENVLFCWSSLPTKQINYLPLYSLSGIKLSTSLYCTLFSSLQPFSHKMDTNFKSLSEKIHFRFTSLAYFAKRIDLFDIRRKTVDKKLNDLHICNLEFSSSYYKTAINLRYLHEYVMKL